MAMAMRLTIRYMMIWKIEDAYSSTFSVALIWMPSLKLFEFLTEKKTYLKPGVALAIDRTSF
jgi:hypothetical protein